MNIGGETLDYKDFHDGLLSISSIIFVFSSTLMIGSIVLKPYIGLLLQERNLIVILCSINLLFSFYYFWVALRLDKIFKLENKNIIKFGKSIGIVTLTYIPHVLIFTSFFFRNIHNLELLMISLIIILEILLIGLIFKEVYDLVFQEQVQRDFEIEANRKKYLERKKKPRLEDEL
jgi:hypothetical protein